MTIKYINKELLASTAVFAELTNNNSDLKQVISEFILSTYVLENTFSQDTNKITQALSRHYEFDIPEAVVKTTLKSIKKQGTIELIEGQYVISPEERIKWDEFNSKISTKENVHKRITDELIQFIEFQKGKLEDTKKEEIIECFSDFLFDDSVDNDYSDLVSAFIIKKSKDNSIYEELNLIREGVTILKGIRYTPEINNDVPWRKELTIYLDAEHLFSVYGYNGDVYKKLMTDLIDLIKSVNSGYKGEGRAIRLKYFEDVEQDIKGFFYAAQKILDGERARGASSVAMNSILEGCKDKSDVIRKESQLFTTLRGMGIIKMDAIDVYENHRYNIEDATIYEKYKNAEAEEEIKNILHSFTAINVLRKGVNNNSFENIGHIIMTGSSLKLRISNDIDAKINNGDFSFATHINYITQRIWFKINKGLGFNNNLPASLDIITKAQILLSNHLNSSVRARYDKIEREVKEGKRNEEDLKDYYLNLRSQTVKPEEIDERNIDEKVLFLYEEEDIEKFQRDISDLKSQARELEELKAEIKAKEEADKRSEEEAFNKKSKELLTMAEKKYKNYKNSMKILLVAISLFSVIMLVTDTDSSLAIVSYFLTAISVIYIIAESKKIDNKIKVVAYKDYNDFLSNKSVD